MDIENSNQCENKKWFLNYDRNLEEGEYDYKLCCFETNNNHSKIKRKAGEKIYNGETGVGCGFDVYKVHLDYVDNWVDGIHDLISWNSKIVYHGARRF